LKRGNPVPLAGRATYRVQILLKQKIYPITPVAEDEVNKELDLESTRNHAQKQDVGGRPSEEDLSARY
jgi:hypothetical protein